MEIYCFTMKPSFVIIAKAVPYFILAMMNSWSNSTLVIFYWIYP